MGFIDSKTEKERKKIDERLEAGDRYFLVTLADDQAQAGGAVSGGWRTLDDGIELMNELAARGLVVVAALAHAVIMDRPPAPTSD